MPCGESWQKLQLTGTRDDGVENDFETSVLRTCELCACQTVLRFHRTHGGV